ncbi:MAG TPA: NAD-dependent epimerase/dehydratase family protein, partial [Gemmatimonadota bacterium]|nr:NAD-dependent epimerase/dehydratase family protein [Gemmatimonadota bacterium]
MAIPLADRRILVTGGAGFLGSHVVEELERRGVPRESVFIPRSAEYDLLQSDAVEKVFSDSDPDVVIHLAAVVGGIGANMERPGDFFYHNMKMGLELMERARLQGVEKFVTV